MPVFAYILILGPIALSIIYSFYVIFWLRTQSKGNAKMIEISNVIQDGSTAYLNRQYRSIAIVALALAIIIYYFLGLSSLAGFAVGAAASALAGYIGMNIAVQSNSKTAEAANQGLNAAFSLAFKAGSVTGFLVVSLGLLAVSGFYLLTQDIHALIGLGFGASLISIFARLGGGIYAKAADVGTDLIGKTEAGIQEDDPRNPGVIAGNVGDNVGDCSGMAADLFETYAVTLIAAMLLGFLIAKDIASPLVIFPLILGGLAILASLIGVYFVKVKKNGTIINALYKGLIGSLLTSALLFYPATKIYFGEGYLNFYGSALIGLLAAALIAIITNYYTASKNRPVKSIAEASDSGHATNIIIGLSVGMRSAFFPILIIVGAILASYALTGLYGIALSATAMLSIAGIIISMDSFGPITDNAAGIAGMSNAPSDIKQIIDSLDSVGNTAKAVTKGYAISSAGLAGIALFGGYAAEFINRAKGLIFELQNPYVLAGLLLGAAIPCLFTSIAIKSVGKAASAVVEEIRRQFREIPGLLDSVRKVPTQGREADWSVGPKPDYGRAVDIVTKAALKEMVVPALIPAVSVLLVGLFLGAKALGGFLIGAIVAGIFLGISMTTGGAAWDNAKKYIEEGNYGGKGSEAHKAAVTGDTVGDPCKDTAGPAINPLIKVINIVALLLAPFL